MVGRVRSVMVPTSRGLGVLRKAREARRNAKEREELIAHAYDLHIEALRVVKDKEEKVRLRRTFESSRSENGFSRIAGHGLLPEGQSGGIGSDG